MTSLDQLTSDWEELSNEYKDLEVIFFLIKDVVLVSGLILKQSVILFPGG